MKPRTFPELFREAEKHDDYWVAGAILAFTESIVREMDRQGISRTELAQRLGATPAYVTKILRGKVNFTLSTMVRLARALDADLNVELSPGTGRSVLKVVGGRESTDSAKSGSATSPVAAGARRRAHR
jgi:transcriptional regulator with XRE-family HTH domain